MHERTSATVTLIEARATHGYRNWSQNLKRFINRASEKPHENVPGTSTPAHCTLFPRMAKITERN